MSSFLWTNKALGQVNILACTKKLIFCQIRTAFKRSDTPDPDPELAKAIFKSAKGTKGIEKEQFPGEFELEPPRGKIYDKKPFRIELDEGKKYSWCSCGHAKSQPMCDGAHKKLDGSAFVKTVPKFRPYVFTVDSSKEYWLCNCKRSSNRPFCDATHRNQDIQDAIKF